jgi:hypothetical protein
LAAVLWHSWLFNYTRADQAAATAIGRELEERMTDAVDPAAQIVTHVPLGLSLFAIGKPLEARTKLEQALRTYSGLKGGPVAYRCGMEVGAVAHGYRAWCVEMLGPVIRNKPWKADVIFWTFLSGPNTPSLWPEA